MQRFTYDISPKGVATSFTETELPTEYARQFRNRHINRAGGAEKRRGIQQEGNDVPGMPTLTNVHEYVDKDGTATLYVSGQGKIYKYDGTNYSEVHDMGDTSKLRSFQFGDFLVFYNGSTRNTYTRDNGTTFSELLALIRSGQAASGSGPNTLVDSDISSWSSSTDVAANDIVYYPGLDAYGLVTGVSGSALSTTAVSAAATGLGAASAEVSAGEPYQLIDLVSLNIIYDGSTYDNVALAGTGTGTGVIAVSGVTFSDTEIKIGDFIRNTTRAAVMEVTAVSANVNVTTVASQAAGDSLVFLKSAMPITSFAHVHYGRAYYVDARDMRKIRISGPDDPQDMTSSTGTLDSISFATGSLQGKGDVILALDSFQSFFVMAGEEQVYIYSGTDPIGSTIDWSPVALLPQGCVSADGLVNIGNAVLFVSHDGVQAITQSEDQNKLQREGVTSAINETLRDELDAVSTSEIQLFHYRQRSWVILKVGSEFWVINYAPSLQSRELTPQVFNASITRFDGGFCRQNAYLERRNDDLVCVGAGGKVYLFDQAVYDDDGEVYTTTFQTGWLTAGGARSGGGERPDKRKKHLKYINPLIEAGAVTTYTFRAEGGYEAEGTDTITVSTSGGSNSIGIATIPFTIGGSNVINKKYPLRVNGEVIRITATTEDNSGPDTLSRYTLYLNHLGAV